MSNKDENIYPRDVQIKRTLAWIGLIGGILILFVMRGTQRPIPELSEQAQSLSDSYVDQLNQEISIARQQGFLAQQQTKVEFLTSVVEQGNELLEDEATPDEKISIGGANYLREEVETDLQSRQERLTTSAAQIDSTQRAIGRMQDALSNLKDLTQFDVNSISGEELLRAQLVALYSVGQLPWPKLSYRESVEGAVKKARADFDHRLDLLGQSSSPDLGDLFAFLEESSVSNFHWREELGLNKLEMEYLGVTFDEDELTDYLERAMVRRIESSSADQDVVTAFSNLPRLGFGTTPADFEIARQLQTLQREVKALKETVTQEDNNGSIDLASAPRGDLGQKASSGYIAPRSTVQDSMVVATSKGYTLTLIVPYPGDKIRFGPFDDPRDVSRLVIQVGNMSEVDLEPLPLSGGQWVGEVTIPLDSGANLSNMPEKVRVKHGPDLPLNVWKV